MFDSGPNEHLANSGAVFNALQHYLPLDSLGRYIIIYRCY